MTTVSEAGAARPTSKPLLLKLFAGTTALVVAAGAGAWLSRRSSTGAQGVDPAAPFTDSVSANVLPSFVPPERTKQRPAPAFSVPDVPPSLANAPAVTLEIETRQLGDRRAPVTRKTVTRTAERVHVSLGPKAPEWLFIRNTKDPRRMSATLADHEHTTLVEHDESELRILGLGRGWVDVVALGVEPEALTELQPTGRKQVLSGITFAELRAPAESKSRIRELWWSDAATAPLRIMAEQGPTRFETRVRSLRRQVDPLLLRDLRERYSGYKVMDVADYREAHHDDGHSDHH